MPYTPNIQRSDLAEINSDESARVEHRRMWFNYGAWSRENSAVLSEPKPAPVNHTEDLGRKPEKSPPTEWEIGEFLRIARITAREAGVKPDELLGSDGNATHPSRRVVISRAKKAGVRICAIATILGVSKDAIYHSVRRVKTDERTERMKARAVA